MGMLRVSVGVSTKGNTEEAVEEAVEQALAAFSGTSPGLVILTATVDHDAALVHAAVRKRIGQVPIDGVTTSLGVLSANGVAMGPQGAVGLMALGGEGIRFRATSAILGEDAEAAGRAVAESLADEQPKVVFFHAPPGKEEDLLRGVQAVLGAVPIFGGSAADHAIAGQWSVFTSEGALNNVISLSAIYGDIAVAGHMLAPYRPQGASAEVTSVEGRTISEIEGKPAAQVLREWVGDSIASQLKHGGNVLAQTALHPLGVRHAVGDGDYYVTIHPANVHAESGALDIFARVSKGTVLCAMEGTSEGLILSLDTLIEETKKKGVSVPRAGVLIYCAGCAGAVGEALDEGLRERWRATMGNTPLIGMCTFGEQGTIEGLGAVHANLSLNLVLLGDTLKV